MPKTRFVPALYILASSMLLTACTGAEQDFCRYLSLDEARSFDPQITSAEMRQTELVRYCVWQAGVSDRLFISLDRALNYHPRDFLKVLAKNSPEENDEVVTLADTGNEGAALFLGDGADLELEFLVAQNGRYSVTIRAPNVERGSAAKLDRLSKIANTVLTRL